MVKKTSYKKIQCQICGKKKGLVAYKIGVCMDCIRKSPEIALLKAQDAHLKSREPYGLPAVPPQDEGILCNQCANQCIISEGQSGYCGVWINKNGKLISKTGTDKAFLHTYLDPLPSNCCASYFCPGTQKGEYNLAAFLYACNFNCLFCQNSSHKNLNLAPVMHTKQIIHKIENNKKISCLCWFGGSPEPQLPFALQVSESVFEKTNFQRPFRICWEWNGGGNPSLIKKAARLALESGGNMKFDLKCFNSTLSKILLGVESRRSYANFRMCAEKYYDQRKEPVLTASTLLVPAYVDEKEVESISKFISDLNPSIPYSLLIFYPHWMLSDLPVTPRDQVEKCYQIAKKYLQNVHIGNEHLLELSS